MPQLFSYRDKLLYCHHSMDVRPDPDAFPIHAHEGYEVFYFLSGAGVYLVEGTSYPLTPGDIMIMRPAEMHRLYISPELPYERIAFHFTEAFLESFDPSWILLRPFRDRPLGQKNLYRRAEFPTLSLSFENFHMTPGLENVQLTARLLLFLTELSDLQTQDFLQSSGGDPLSTQILSFVNAHLYESISLQSVSETFSRSASQIGRIFRRATGASFWEYVTLKRLLAARAMLQRGDSAADAAFACGFTDYSAFYRAYRAHFQCPPSRDRLSRS